MFNISNVLSNVLYADDTCIYLRGSDIAALFDLLNVELNSLYEWLNANKLTLNVDKTFYMIFHRTRIKTDELSLRIGQGTLKETSHHKYLGLIIDNKLNWSAHISHVKNKVSKCVGILLKARTYLSRKCLLNLYHAFAYPYLIYCLALWGHSSDTILRPIFLVQKKVVRIITFSDFLAHTRPIFLKLNLLPLSKVILQRTSIFMYKLMNDMLPAALDYLIIILKGNYILLNCNRVHRANNHNTDYHPSMSHSILHCHPFQSTIHTLYGRGQFHHYDPTVPQINHRSHNQHHHLNYQRQFHPL